MNTANIPEIRFPGLGIEIDHLSRVAFSVFGFPIYFYGLIITCGAIIAFFVAKDYIEKTGQNLDIYLDYLIYNVPIIFIGLRLYYVLFSLDYYMQYPEKILNFRDGGLAIYGAIITAAITAYIYTKRKKISFMLFADTATPSLILGQAIGRWGNFFNMEAFGGYTENFLRMQYLKDVVRQKLPQDVLNNIVNVNGYEYIQVHPTFLYESLWNFLLFFILIIYRKNKKFDGEIMLLYFIGYGIGRFFIESLRTDQLLIGSTNIPISMVVSVIAIAAALVIYYKKLTLLKNTEK